MFSSIKTEEALTIRTIFIARKLRLLIVGFCFVTGFVGSTAFADHHDIGDACRQGDKLYVRDNASYVIYYNEQNFPVQIEDLAGEKNRRICQMDPAGSACPPGYCQITILGVNYCKKC